MTRILGTLIAFIIVSGCKDNKIEKEAMLLTGTWQLKEVGKTVNSDLKWEEASAKQQTSLTFNSSGEVVDSEGFKAPCGPTSLIINGGRFEIKQTAPVSNSGFYVLCASCNTWVTELKKDELIISICSSDKLKFKKQ